MANTRHTYHLHSKEVEEIIRNNGLPDEISTETQLWDLIIKKATYSSPKLLFPLIYEIYGKDYPKDSTVVPLSTEYSVERSDTKEISTIKADLTFCVNDADIYHFECEITYDGQITIRMLEYDLHAALTFRSDTKNTQLVLEFPKSAVLFLQGAKKIPDYLSCQLKFQDGSTHEYRVPTVKVQSYTLEEIKRRIDFLLHGNYTYLRSGNRGRISNRDRQGSNFVPVAKIHASNFLPKQRLMSGGVHYDRT